MSAARELMQQYVEDRDSLADEELETLLAALRGSPQMALELKDQLILDDLLAQRLDLTRWHFLPQVDQRVRDEAADFPGLLPAGNELPGGDSFAVPRGQCGIKGTSSSPGPPSRASTSRRFEEDRAALDGNGRNGRPPVVRGNRGRISVTKRRLDWGWAAISLVLLAAMGLVGGVVFFGNHATVAVLEAVDGNAKFVRREQSRPAKTSDVIQPGDQLITPPGATVVVRYRDGTLVKFDSETTGRFPTMESATAGKLVQLDFGRLSAEVAPQPPGRPMVFQSSTASAEVLGTALELRVADDQTQLTVTEGRVRLTRGGDRKSVVVAKDEFAVADASGITSAPVAWPSNRDGLIFLFETNNQPNLVRSITSGVNRGYTIRPRGRARLNHDYAMVLDGGAFLAEDVDGEILAACRQTNQLTVEAAIRPTLAEQAGPARIVTFSTDVSQRDFTLGQLGNQLVVRIRTPQSGPNGVDGVDPGLSVCSLTPNEVNHVIVSYKPGRLVCFLNGRLVFDGDQFQGDFRDWSAQHLLFGDEYGGQRDWKGTLEGVAIFNRFMEPEEAARNALQYQHLLRGRMAAPQVRVRGELIAKSAMPTVEEIQPYRSALVVCRYRVKQVVSGELDEGDVFVVQWAILDDETQPIVDLPLGTEIDLLLESFDRNPQVSRCVRSDDFLDGPDAARTRYFEVQ